MTRFLLVLFSLLCLLGTGCDTGGNGCDPGTPEPPQPPSYDDPAIDPNYKDPGTGPFTRVDPEECGLDANLLRQADRTINTPYIIVRYGLLCHEYLPSGRDRSGDVFSATKTLGGLVTGVASYETRNIPRTGRKTGQLLDTDRADHWLDRISYNEDAHVAHVLAMVAHNRNLDNGSMRYTYDTVGSTQINTLSTMVATAISQDAGRLGRNVQSFTQKFVFDPLGMDDSSWGGNVYATGWNTTLDNMARLGLVIMHRGQYNGKRVLSEYWTYRMTHPAFEESNTNYGYLTWLNSRGGGTGIGGLGAGVQEDPCSPPAIWNDYPHGLSQSLDCKADRGFDCTQENDMGVWSAQGMGGQFIVGHPGLDLLICAKNFSNGGGPTGLWDAVRPAMVAMDPVYQGDENAFCRDYGGSSYAPDMPTQPTP